VDPRALLRIERMNYVFAGLLIALLAALGTREQLLGAAIGSVVSCLNFSAVRRIVERTLRARAKDGGSGQAMFMLPKMMILIFVVAAAIYLLPLSPVFLALGFSIFLLSIAIESVRFIMAPPSGGDGTSHG
jgi:hypothetical protein